MAPISGHDQWPPGGSRITISLQEGDMLWRTLRADGCEWEVGVVSSEDEEIIEVRPKEQTRPPRRIAIAKGALATMDDEALKSAYTRARPIGGDFYGRPGKRMSDMNP
jgi:hypothetical protein